MPEKAGIVAPPDAWNVLTSPWIETLGLNAGVQVLAPLDALRQASGIRCIAAASPLDLFAAHRFLLTLLYWKADEAGGVNALRASLLGGVVPNAVIEAIASESKAFRLFDETAPFLQDPTAKRDGEDSGKSVGSLQAEFACATNIAHFHHGDDTEMRLCFRCATVGMMRVIPWTQSGGQGLTPSIHNAPPNVCIALGASLVETLGLNLIQLSGDPGQAEWSGHFVPSNRAAPIPYLEALTWNPRRIRLPNSQAEGDCWGCGLAGRPVIGRIVYAKNEDTKLRKGKGDTTVPFEWTEPAAFYSLEPKARFMPIKSGNEERAATALDLESLYNEQDTPRAAIVDANPECRNWNLIVPCTDPANNKTFDCRAYSLATLAPEFIKTNAPPGKYDGGKRELDGWIEPLRDTGANGSIRFVRTAARLLSHGDWLALSNAAFLEMHESPAAFDILSGLLWPLRGKVAGLPSRHVAWLVLKLMAAVPQAARVTCADACFSPLNKIPKRQIDKKCNVPSPYPATFPKGHRLETELRKILEVNARLRQPNPIDWPGFCDGLLQLLD